MPKRGITRAAAEKAVGTLRFAAADKVTAACPIEKGTVCMTAEGVRFETTEDAAIAVGSQWADVPAQAVEAGFTEDIRQNVDKMMVPKELEHAE